MKSYEKPGHYKGDADPQVAMQKRGKSIVGKKKFGKSKKRSQKRAKK